MHIYLFVILLSLVLSPQPTPCRHTTRTNNSPNTTRILSTVSQQPHLPNHPTVPTAAHFRPPTQTHPHIHTHHDTPLPHPPPLLPYAAPGPHTVKARAAGPHSTRVTEASCTRQPPAHFPYLHSLLSLVQHSTTSNYAAPGGWLPRPLSLSRPRQHGRRDRL